MTPFDFAVRRHRRAMHLGALLLLVAGFAGAQAAPPAAPLRGLLADGDWMLQVNGKDQPAAEIFGTEPARAFLLISSELPSPLLLSVAGGTVETVDLMKVSRQIDGSIDLLPGASLGSAVKYTVRESDITFDIAGKTVVMKPRPWKLGLHKGPELLSSNPVYQRGAKGYNPDTAILKRLKDHKESVRVLTFFGSWCPHCKAHLPLLLKVEQGLTGSKIQFDYYGLPRPFGDDAEAKKYGITGVPTAILFVDGKEIGRIPNSQWSNPEVALDLQLNGPGRSKGR